MFKIFILVIMFARQVSAFSLSADEMYRDLLNYENKSPPDVIVNRTTPEVTPFKEDEKYTPPPDVKEKEKETVRNKDLEDTYQKLVEQKKNEEKQKWQKIVRSVQKNHPIQNNHPMMANLSHQQAIMQTVTSISQRLRIKSFYKSYFLSIFYTAHKARF